MSPNRQGVYTAAMVRETWWGNIDCLCHELSLDRPVPVPAPAIVLPVRQALYNQRANEHYTEGTLKLSFY